MAWNFLILCTDYVTTISTIFSSFVFVGERKSHEKDVFIIDSFLDAFHNFEVETFPVLFLLEINR